MTYTQVLIYLLLGRRMSHLKTPVRLKSCLLLSLPCWYCCILPNCQQFKARAQWFTNNGQLRPPCYCCCCCQCPHTLQCNAAACCGSGGEKLWSWRIIRWADKGWYFLGPRGPLGTPSSVRPSAFAAIWAKYGEKTKGQAKRQRWRHKCTKTMTIYSSNSVWKKSVVFDSNTTDVGQIPHIFSGWFGWRVVLI